MGYLNWVAEHECEGKMNDDMNKRRDELAKNHGIEKYPVHPLTNNGFTQDINFARRMSHTQSFQDGWDARDAIANEQLAEMQAQVDALICLLENTEAALGHPISGKTKVVPTRDNVLAKYIQKENISLKAQVDELKKAKELYEFEFHKNQQMTAQLKAKDAVIDVAVKALVKYKDAAFDIKGKIYAVGAPAKEALEQIQKMRGG